MLALVCSAARVLPAAMDAEGTSRGEDGVAGVAGVLLHFEDTLHLGNVLPHIFAPVDQVTSGVPVQARVAFEELAADQANFVPPRLFHGSSSGIFGLLAAAIAPTHLPEDVVVQAGLGVEVLSTVLAAKQATRVFPHYVVLYRVLSGVALLTEVTLVLALAFFYPAGGRRANLQRVLVLRSQLQAMRHLVIVNEVRGVPHLAQELLVAQGALVTGTRQEATPFHTQLQLRKFLPAAFQHFALSARVNATTTTTSVASMTTAGMLSQVAS